MKRLFGFSIAEALVVLLIVSLVVILTAPMITKKRKDLNSNKSHGKWACKYINDTLHSASVEDIDKALPPDNKWEKGCTFPAIAKDVKNLWVEVYGAGGGGARGFATPWISKTDSYNLGTPAPRDGEYDLNVLVQNAGTAMYWDDTSSIYYSSDSKTRATCGSSKFGEYKKEDTTYSYGSCTNYTAADVCVYTGDSTAIKTSNCIKKAEQAGKYCYKYSYDRPPNSYISDANLVAACTAAGYKQCKSTGSSVTYVVENEKCINQRSLPSVRGGNASPSIKGKIRLIEGESVSLEMVKTGESHKSGKLDRYKYTSAYNGDDYELYHMKGNSAGGIFEVSKKLVAKMNAGKAGTFSTSTSGASSCCTSCGNVATYPNSASSSTFCAYNGKDGETKLSYGGLYTGSGSGNGLSIVNQYFEHFKGCNGETGSYSANLFPTSRTPNYKIVVGRGGSGAQGGDDNTVTKSAQDGESTTFGWITGKGGKGASDYCKTEKAENPKTNIYNAGIGGIGGIVNTPGGNAPKRNYALSINEDTAPNSRWMVQNGNPGNSGMIVVSW